MITIDPVKAAEIKRNSMPALSALQLRLALLGLGFTGADVEAKIASMPASAAAREAARIEWEYATVFPRHHPLIDIIGGALGLTEAQIDNAWLAAAAV